MSETACGKARDSSTATDKEFSCPTCNDSFDTKNGLGVHHAHKHGESIAFGEYECDICGCTFERRRCNMKDEHEYQTCSRECQNKLIGKLNEGEKNHKYVESWVNCSWCDAEIEVKPQKLETQENYFCGFECMGNWVSENQCGENHVQYKEDKPKSRFYQTAKWKRVRDKAKRRDNHTCQACTSNENLIVHHIIPLAQGGPKYDLENLTTLCRSCHSKWEGLYLKPDNRGVNDD